MVYGVPIEQLKNRSDELYEKARAGGPMAPIYAADARYHESCIPVQRIGIGAEDPVVKRAQQLYIAALAKEAQEKEFQNVADEIDIAAAQFDDFI